ncbi:hypothetical protein SAMN02910358_01846 [Lachnospiraceae bacterium XBB1006]|nr:hypothetical protein SAMN02910358_01846 [Lachnospiraceae bacterium XBB1006]
MPLPIIIGGIAAVAGVAGVGSGIHGGVKMKEANDTMSLAKRKQENAVKRFNERNKATTAVMDELGTHELEILSTFDEFTNIIEKIQSRPEFKAYKREGVNLPKYEAEELKKISTGAGVLLGGIGGAAAGTAGGFAAAGATTSAITALGTASTGAAISGLSGAAATNATLAVLGGGTIASGGGGVALGATILSGATLGIGLLVGGLIVNATGAKLSNKADEAYNQAKRTENEVDKIVSYLNDLTVAAYNFGDSLDAVDKVYRKHLSTLEHIVDFEEKTEWNEFSDKEKKITENTVLLVGLLYSMCQIKLVLKQDKKDEINKINYTDINGAVNKAQMVLDDIQKAS